MSRRGGSHKLLALALFLGASTAAAQDAWTELGQAHDAISDYAWSADFVQTYVPAGFSSGESEAGLVSLKIPGMLQWDYDLPYEKSFLIRGATAFTWNAGETSGRKTLLQPADLNHLALLELDLGALRQRYEAEASRTEAGVEIHLVPLEAGHEIRDATLTLEPETHHLVGLAYSDVEGNTTRFELSGHRVAAKPGLFSVPEDLDWIDY